MSPASDPSDERDARPPRRRREHRQAQAATPSPSGIVSRSILLTTVGALAIGISLIAVAVLAGNRPDSTDGNAPSVADHPSPSRSSSASMAPSAEGAPPSIAIATPAGISPNVLEAGRTIGRPDALATLVVWGDFQCPFCGEFTRKTEPRLYSDYVLPGKLKIVYRDWVFIGPESVSAAAAARCAGDQGQFWPYHDYLLWNQQGENEGAFNRDRLDAIATILGLDLPAFRSCLADPATIDAIKAETEAGTAAGIGMTPTLVVDDRVLPGSVTSEEQYARLRAVIDASIAAHSNGASTANPSQP